MSFAPMAGINRAMFEKRSPPPCLRNRGGSPRRTLAIPDGVEYPANGRAPHRVQLHAALEVGAQAQLNEEQPQNLANFCGWTLVGQRGESARAAPMAASASGTVPADAPDQGPPLRPQAATWGGGPH